MSNELSSQVRDLPILKHFNESEIQGKVDSFRNGEKGLFWFIKLAFFGAIGFAVWKYVLPTVFVAIGQMLAIVASGIFILAVIIMLPVILKGLRTLTRSIHKTLIRYDPFETLYQQKALMVQNQLKFRASKGIINGLKNDCEIEADKNERDAKALTAKILVLDEKAKKFDAGMKEMLAKDGIAAKSTDEYINLSTDFMKTVAESQRVSAALAQAKDYVKKYGVRIATMSKFGQKLTMVEASMDIKILDFDATIEMLKKDYDFAEKSKNATNAAKSAMLFTKGWELDYAIDVVTSTISSDIAITAGNLKDIDSLTKNFAIDSDELYANLDTLASNIRGGNEVIPEAKTYRNPDYQMTASDKAVSGGLGDIF